MFACLHEYTCTGVPSVQSFSHGERKFFPIGQFFYSESLNWPVDMKHFHFELAFILIICVQVKNPKKQLTAFIIKLKTNNLSFLE